VSYQVNELFYTLQGEGTHAGRPAVFVRFSGCNLWTGIEADRDRAACRFCDTDFVDAPLVFDDAMDLAKAVSAELPKNAWNYQRPPMVVLTGGEPLLQVDKPLLDALHQVGLFIAVETNGTKPVHDAIDWVCVSPKAGTVIRARRADELKLVFPQPNLSPDHAEAAIKARSQRLQPMDGPDLQTNTVAAIQYVLDHPQWSLSLQTHKMIGIR
jgi:7-carboxy-7-deazaguanine synthase